MEMSLSRFLLLLAAAAQISGTQAAEVVIDDFTVAQSTTGSVVGGGILGGERDAVISGSNLLSISGGSAVMSLPLAQTGNFIILEWDGEDNASANAYLLGDVDLTDGGSNGSFFLNVTAVSGSVDGFLYVYESASEFATLNFDIDHTGLFELPLESFPDSNPAPDFTTINRLGLRIIMDPGESVTINQFRVGPGTIPLFFEDGFENLLPW